MTNPSLNSFEPLVSILPIKSILVTLQTLESVEMGMLHHIPLTGWLRNLLDSPEDFNQYLVVDPLENGHHKFEAGNLYAFRVISTAKGGHLLEQIVDRLRALPESAQHIERSALFNRNVKLHQIHDGFSFEPFHSVTELHPIGVKSLTDTIEPLKDITKFELSFQTPAVLLKNDKSQSHTQALKYCRDQRDFDWPTLCKRIGDSFVSLLSAHVGSRFQRPEWPNGEAISNVSIWMEYRYKRQKKKKIGGVLTKIICRFEEPLADWQWAMLILGQCLGIGQNRGLGFGQYRLSVCSSHWERPAGQASMLRSAFAFRNIDKALDHNIKKHGLKHGLQGKDYNCVVDKLSELAQSIKYNRYVIPPLSPYDIDRPDGDKRHLSIPPWEDRILQRSVSQLLASTFDTHWIKSSYGYRVGHSRYQARDKINALIQQGYHWILEADIKRFFDNVCWDNLEQRLTLLYPNDDIVPVIMNWMKASVRDDKGIVHHREKGLPQGSPLSPVLANLIMDDFDSDMQAYEYNIVRFADDFVLLFKNEASAQAALSVVRKSLIEHHLELNHLKTRITHSRHGFRFLGFYFVDGYAIETKLSSDQVNEPNAVTPFFNPPSQQSLDEEIGDRKHIGTVLTITGEVAILSRAGNKLKVVQGEKENTFSWNSLECVVLIGPHQVTTPALKIAMSTQTPIYFADSYGQYEGVSAKQLPALGSNLWVLQASVFQNVEWCLEQSRDLVSARIDGISSFIYRRDRSWSGIDKLSRLKKNIRTAESLSKLRGYEGQAAKTLWAFFQDQISSEWQFTGRNRLPPKDPVNAMLSLSYTFLHNLCDTACHASGLNTWQSYYHQTHGTHAVLASDLIEPFRIIAERVVMTCIKKRRLVIDDFAITDSGCKMSSEARKTLIHALLSDLTQTRSKYKQRIVDDIFDQPKHLKQGLYQHSNYKVWRL